MRQCQTCIFSRSIDKTVTFFKNDVIFFEGDKVDKVYKVKSGIIKLTKLYQNGEVKLVDVIKSEDYLALLTILKGNTEYIVTATSLNDVVLEEINIAKAVENYKKNTDFKEMCLTCAGNRLGVFQNQLFNFSNLDIEEKIINVLTHLYQKFGYTENSRHFLKLPITKTDIANMIGLRRETLSRKLTILQNNNILKIEKNLYEFLSM